MIFILIIYKLNIQFQQVEHLHWLKLKIQISLLYRTTCPAFTGSKAYAQGHATKLALTKLLIYLNQVGENGILVYGSDEGIIEDLSFNHIRFELTDSKLNDVAGGNIDLRGASIPKTLFKSDIPGLLIQYAKDVRINDFELT